MIPHSATHISILNNAIAIALFIYFHSTTPQRPDLGKIHTFSRFLSNVLRWFDKIKIS